MSCLWPLTLLNRYCTLGSTVIFRFRSIPLFCSVNFPYLSNVAYRMVIICVDRKRAAQKLALSCDILIKLMSVNYRRSNPVGMIGFCERYLCEVNKSCLHAITRSSHCHLMNFIILKAGICRTTENFVFLN